MDFTNDILAPVKEEITRVAMSAYDDNGNSIYDAVMCKSRDTDTLNRMYADAVSALVTRTSDICTYSKDDDDDEETIEFDVVDIDEDTLPLAAQEIERYIILNIVGAWLQEKLADRSTEYIERGQAALEKAVKILKTRKKPTRV